MNAGRSLVTGILFILGSAAGCSGGDLGGAGGLVALASPVDGDNTRDGIGAADQPRHELPDERGARGESSLDGDPDELDLSDLDEDLDQTPQQPNVKDVQDDPQAEASTRYALAMLFYRWGHEGAEKNLSIKEDAQDDTSTRDVADALHLSKLAAAQGHTEAKNLARTISEVHGRVINAYLARQAQVQETGD
jgi:hypothetical protein